MRWLRRRHEDLDERVERATAERELSEQRLETLRAGTTQPMIERGERNQFADIIRRSLREGHPEARREGRTA